MRLVLGLQPVREAVRAHGGKVEQVLVEEGDHPQLEALARFARDQGIAVTRAPRSDLDRRARGARVRHRRHPVVRRHGDVHDHPRGSAQSRQRALDQCNDDAPENKQNDERKKERQSTEGRVANGPDAPALRH